MRKFDLDIIFGFLSDEDKKHFMVWDNVWIVGNNIVVTWKVRRAPYDRTISITIEDYENTVKQKERENKLNKIL